MVNFEWKFESIPVKNVLVVTINKALVTINC